jgi:hypothetical protein
MCFPLHAPAFTLVLIFMNDSFDRPRSKANAEAFSLELFIESVSGTARFRLWHSLSGETLYLIG